MYAKYLTTVSNDLLGTLTGTQYLRQHGTREGGESERTSLFLSHVTSMCVQGSPRSSQMDSV